MLTHFIDTLGERGRAQGIDMSTGVSLARDLFPMSKLEPVGAMVKNCWNTK